MTDQRRQARARRRGWGTILLAWSLYAASPGAAAHAQDPTGAEAGRAALPAPFTVVDLSHTLDSAFPFIPVPGVTFPFGLEPIATLAEHGVAANAWRIHEHLGTQIDAPSHFVQGGRALHELPAEKLLVPVVVIDFREQALADRDAELTVPDILAWESVHGRIPEGAVVVVYTGWDARLTEGGGYIGLDADGVKHFPGIGAEAARFLVRERSIWGVGVDTISLDPGYDGEYRAHRAILGGDKWALEALANIRYVPPRGAVLFIGALKVRGATGGPARVLALVPPAPQLNLSAFHGRWKSEQPERIDRPDGATVYVTREFAFHPGRWTLRFTVARDAEGSEPLFTGDFGGAYEIGRYTPLAQAHEARFDFDHRALTARDLAVAAALNAAGCGREPWEPGTAQSVHREGCRAFRVYPFAECAGEFDLVALRGDRLFLGRRPADGNLCTAARRPVAPTDRALVRAR